jgi:hypothetical protein
MTEEGMALLKEAIEIFDETGLRALNLIVRYCSWGVAAPQGTMRGWNADAVLWSGALARNGKFCFDPARCCPLDRCFASELHRGMRHVKTRSSTDRRR